jgi:hypothetical protein
MRKGIRAGKNKTNQTSASRKGFVHVRRLVIALGVFIIVAASAHGQTPVFIKDSVSSEEAGPSRIKAIKCWKEGATERGDATGCVAKIGYVVSLEVGNLAGWLEKLKTDKVIDSEKTGEALVLEQLPKLNLFIGEHLMKTLQPTEYTKDDPAWYDKPNPPDPVQKKAAPGRSWLEFTLKRDAANKLSRADWDPVLRTPGISPKMDLAVGIYDGNRNTAHVMAPTVGANMADPQLEFHLRRIAWDGWTVVGLILLIGAIIGFLYLLLRSGIVRDTTCAVREDGLPPLSLGRCQMAFWFFLVICAFYFLWLITGRGDTDTVNSTILILIGISAGTGLGSAILSKNEAETDAAKQQAEADAAGGVAPAVVAPAPNPTPPPPTPTPLEPKEIVVYPDKIKAAKAALAQAKEAKNIDQVTAQTIEVTKWKRALKHWRARNRGQLLKDLLSEEDASAGQGRVITFHRFQIVGWTLILGVVFVSEVLSKLAMPVFDATLLTLMGISSGTYLGFKVSAK